VPEPLAPLDFRAHYADRTHPLRYVGQLGYYTDSETSEVYVRARTVQPANGRWVCRDPIAFQESLNLYLYTLNNPQRFVDPSGLFGGPIVPPGKPFPPQVPRVPPYDPTKQLPKYPWQVRIFLKSALSSGCSQCNYCNNAPTGCDEITCMNDAKLISDAIANTLEQPGNWPWKRLPIGVHWEWPPALHPNERYKGYWCWNWADALQQSAAAVASPCFSVELHASGDAVSGRMHWFTAIETCDGRVIYVDDSFWNQFFCHYGPPCGGIYKDWGECKLPEELRRRYPLPHDPNGTPIY